MFGEKPRAEHIGVPPLASTPSSRMANLGDSGKCTSWGNEAMVCTLSLSFFISIKLFSRLSETAAAWMKVFLNSHSRHHCFPPSLGSSRWSMKPGDIDKPNTTKWTSAKSITFLKPRVMSPKFLNLCSSFTILVSKDLEMDLIHHIVCRSEHHFQPCSHMNCVHAVHCYGGHLLLSD